MEIFKGLWNEILLFFSIQPIYEILQSGDYSTLTTYKGITALMYPIIPLLLVLELIVGLIYKKPQIKVYRMTFLVYLFNRFVGRFIAIAMVAYSIGIFGKYAIIDVPKTWYGFVYGYIIWEFGHFIYHYLAHKVRLFWCLHSTHHAPEDMNLAVSHAHFFLEAPYADIIRTTTCILLGVSPVMLSVIMFVDGTYGAFIHVGENLIKNARLGWFERIILTPSHHRVHHARNPLYMDTNFCNLLNIWDLIFKTYQREEDHEPIQYGITRKVDSNSFWDVYFGEILALAKDVIAAPGILNKIQYLFMPPGWSHNGVHRTAKVVRAAYYEERNHVTTAPPPINKTVL